MTPRFEILDRRLPGGEVADEAVVFAREVRQGLSGTPRTLPSKYFYDDAGSRLFREITELAEYYLTSAEDEVLRTHGDALAALYDGTPLELVELGAGDGRKTAVLLDAFVRRGADVRYRPVDISHGALLGLLESLSARFGDELETGGLRAEYFDALHWLRTRTERPLLVLFLGSNIGNFTAAGAEVFLRRLRTALAPGDRVLVGFDLVKAPEILVRAYADSQGVTREFNLNLLDRLNRELGADFDRAGFRHEARWDPDTRAMQSWLVSRRAQTVRIPASELTVELSEGEGIRTELSHKYRVEDIEALAAAAGFSPERLLFDAHRRFADALWLAG